MCVFTCLDAINIVIVNVVFVANDFCNGVVVIASVVASAVIIV